MVWSAPFDLEKMEDLQIKFLSKETPAEKKLNVFQKQWFFPRGASQTRFARVFIYTQDEATIHIAFLDPKDPDFKIFNKTEDVFTIRQKGSSESYVLKEESSMSWVWDNNLKKNKRIEISIGKLKKSFAIEKVKDMKNKKFGKYEVNIIVTGITRELVIKAKEGSSEEVSIDSIQSKTISKTAFISNPEKMLVKKRTTIKDANKSEIFGIIQLNTESRFNIILNIAEIGVSVVDGENNEMFYITMQNLMVDRFTITKKTGVNINTETEDSISLQHFQIDSMESGGELFPVIIFPIRHERDLTKIVKNDEKNPNQTQLFDISKINIDHDAYKFF